VTVTLTSTTAPQDRVATRRRYLMCRPDFFSVAYAINPWMDTAVPVDIELAIRQWEQLVATYLRLGHEVELIEPLPELPDMVFAANGGLVIDGTAFGARFTHAERQPEGPAYLARLSELGMTPVAPAATNEGEGDFLVVGRLVLAGTGFRTDHHSHDEVQELFGRPVITLQLIDPSFYHLDTAVAVLDDHNIAYYPPAFTAGSQAVLERLFPDAVIADEDDAAVLGLNAVSDGMHVVLSEAAHSLRRALSERGYSPIGVDLSELLKAGGSVKCCTLELRA